MTGFCEELGEISGIFLGFLQFDALITFIQQGSRSSAGVRNWKYADSDVKLVNSGIGHGVVNSFSASLCVFQSTQLGLDPGELDYQVWHLQ